MTYTLVLLFVIEGELTLLDGFYPRVYDTKVECLERMERTMEYVEAQEGLPSVGVVGCMENGQ